MDSGKDLEKFFGTPEEWEEAYYGKEAMVQKGKRYHCTLFDTIKKESAKDIRGNVITELLTEDERDEKNSKCRADHTEWVHTEDYKALAGK